MGMLCCKLKKEVNEEFKYEVREVRKIILCLFNIV